MDCTSPADSLPHEITIRRLMLAAAGEYVRDYAHYFAGAMVYYSLLSLVPVLVLALAALAWLLRFSHLVADAEQQLLQAIEMRFGNELRTAVEQSLAQLGESSLMATVIGLAGLLLTASALFHHLRMTFRALWKQPPPLASGSILGGLRATLVERAIAFSIMMGGGGLLLAILTTTALLQGWIVIAGNLPLLGAPLSWLLAVLSSLAAAPIAFGFLYRFLAPVKLNWRDVWLAAIFASVAWIVGAEILTLYAIFAADGLSAYGAISAVFVLMLWMHAVGKVLFFGAEICKVCWQHRSQ